METKQTFYEKHDESLEYQTSIQSMRDADAFETIPPGPRLEWAPRNVTRTTPLSLPLTSLATTNTQDKLMYVRILVLLFSFGLNVPGHRLLDLGVLSCPIGLQSTKHPLSLCVKHVSFVSMPSA